MATANNKKVTSVNEDTNVESGTETTTTEASTNNTSTQNKEVETPKERSFGKVWKYLGYGAAAAAVTAGVFYGGKKLIDVLSSKVDNLDEINEAITTVTTA